jgi:5-methylcytosine-specific restriction endonuclease McrA
MGWHPFRDAKTRAEWRDYLMLKQRSSCAICGHRFPAAGEVSESIEIEFAATFDHIVPRSAGGHDGLGNLRLVHYGCNRARGDGNPSKPAPAVPRKLRSSPAPE